MLRANSRLRSFLGESGVDLVEFAATTLQRVLPHVEVSNCPEGPRGDPYAAWGSNDRREIQISLAVGNAQDSRSRSLMTSVKRRQLSIPGGAARGTLDTREHDICKRFVSRFSE